MPGFARRIFAFHYYCADSAAVFYLSRQIFSNNFLKGQKLRKIMGATATCFLTKVIFALGA